MSAPRRLPRAVVWFGVVSFLTDASSEMIYPLLPRFLTLVLGATAGFVGAVEGVAEATSSLLKLVSGRLADRLPRKKPLTVLGYGLSSLARPLVALATAPWMVLAIRFTDRLGKGVRSTPRDVIVADVTPPERRGAAYGYHRAMDNAGAVLGPLIGFALIEGLGFGLRATFAWAALPGVLAMVALAWGVREPPRHAPPAATGDDGTSPNDARLPRFLIAFAFFTLSNSSDAFLLLRASEVGVDASKVLLLWTLHNATKATLGRRFGALSDRLGRHWLIGGGWLFYSACYLGFGWASAPWHIWALFPLYGVYYALVEGSERALVADWAGAGQRGRAFGWFHVIAGLGALPASLGFGALYHLYGARAAFTIGALVAGAATLVLVAWVRPGRSQ